MSRGEAGRRIRLRRASGAEVSEPFLEIDEELWDPEGRRLTLLFDPGRIKRGLLSREEAGGALIPGERYSLIIDGGWPDAFAKRKTSTPNRQRILPEHRGDTPRGGASGASTQWPICSRFTTR